MILFKYPSYIKLDKCFQELLEIGIKNNLHLWMYLKAWEQIEHCSVIYCFMLSVKNLLKWFS